LFISCFLFVAPKVNANAINLGSENPAQGQSSEERKRGSQSKSYKFLFLDHIIMVGNRLVVGNRWVKRKSFSSDMWQTDRK
jgi:hypothetical protein